MLTAGVSRASGAGKRRECAGAIGDVCRLWNRHPGRLSPLQRKKDTKILQNEAKIFFGINKSIRKNVQNEPI